MTAIKLTGQQIKRLRDALLNAYSKKALKDLLLFNLEKTISHIVSETEDARTIVSEVIATARQEGWLSDLIKQVLNVKPAQPLRLEVKDFEKLPVTPSANGRSPVGAQKQEGRR